MILACPTCDGRYNVTGYEEGQQFRCRCGTVLTLHAPSPQAGQLACPHCGAGVSPTASKCEYCSADLLAKACPRCLARCFVGHKHCPECGAELEVAALGEVQKDMPCPRCDTLLRARRVGDVVIDECGKCQGLFLDKVAVERVILDRQQARAEALMGDLPRRESPGQPPGSRMYIKCPTCKSMMNRKLFAAGSGVIVDVCRAHGTFFDAGELPAIVEFVMKGGLEQAQKKELERLRDQAAYERARAEAAAVNAGQLPMGWQVPPSPGLSAGGALIDLLSVLFR